MKPLHQLISAAALAALFVGLPMQAQAIFEDADARREILKMRKQIEELTARLDRIEPLAKRVDTKIDTKADAKSVIDLSTENERLRSEVATLRGQLEVMTNELANAQRRERDLYGDVDARLRKLEPKRMTIDGREVDVDTSEQKAFDAAVAQFKSGNYPLASQALAGFLQRYPDSGYVPQTYFWLGSSYFAQSDCTNALPAYQTVTTRFPMSQRASDAMLNMASCQMDMNDKAAARETLETLLKKYPASQAAITAKGRLAELK